MSVTQEEIAQKAKVSRSIVSKILSNAPESRVSEDTRLKVLQIADKLNYKPKRLVQRHHNIVIGLYDTEYMSEYFFSAIISGIAQQTAVFDFDMQFLSTNLITAEIQPDLYFLNRLKNRNVKGYIIIDDVVPDSEILKLKRDNVPCVLLDREIPDSNIPCILLDKEKVSYDLTSYLIHRGHQKITYLILSKKWDSDKRKIRGFKRALEENGLEYSEDMILEVKDFNFNEMDVEATNIILKIIKQKDHPTAIIANHDKEAARFIQTANSIGMKVPDDLAVIGWNDSDLAPFFTPSLSSVRIPLREMGEMAIVFLENLIEEKKIESNKIILEQKIIIRNSC